MRFVVAGVVAAAVTSVQLRIDHQLWPVHNPRKKALGWWSSLVALDVAVALLAVWALARYAERVS